MKRKLTQIDLELGGWLSNVLEEDEGFAPEELKECIRRWMNSFEESAFTDLWHMSNEELEEFITKERKEKEDKKTRH